MIGRNDGRKGNDVAVGSRSAAGAAISRVVRGGPVTANDPQRSRREDLLGREIGDVHS
jgi:hypothetical protein